MAQGNFWRSFYNGFEAGDKMYRRFEEAARRRDIGQAGKIDQIESSEYSPEQLAQLRDPAEQAGGQWDQESQSYRMPSGEMQAPTYTPTIENGQYQTADGLTVAPRKSYTLDGVTRDTAFSPEEVRSARLAAMANVYNEYGDPEKAMSLHEMADNAKLRGYQIDREKNESEYQKQWKDFAKTQSEIQSGHAIAQQKFAEDLKTDPIAAARGYANWYNQYVPDGNRVYVSQDGHISLASDDGSISQSNLNVFNPSVQRQMLAAGTQAVDAHINKAMPMRDFNQWQAMRQYNDGRKDRADDVTYRNDRAAADDSKTNRQFDFMGRQLDQNDRHFNQNIDWNTAKHNDDMEIEREKLKLQGRQVDAIAGYRDAISSGKSTVYGVDKVTNMPVFQNERGQMTYADGTPVTRDGFKNVQPIKAPRQFDPAVQAKMFETAAAAAEKLKSPDGKPLSSAYKATKTMEIFTAMLGQEADPYTTAADSIEGDKPKPAPVQKKGLGKDKPEAAQTPTTPAKRYSTTSTYTPPARGVRGVDPNKNVLDIRKLPNVVQDARDDLRSGLRGKPSVATRPVQPVSKQANAPVGATRMTNDSNWNTNFSQRQFSGAPSGVRRPLVDPNAIVEQVDPSRIDPTLLQHVDPQTRAGLMDMFFYGGAAPEEYSGANWMTRQR